MKKPFTILREDWDRAAERFDTRDRSQFGDSLRTMKAGFEGKHTCYCVLAEAFKRQFPHEPLVGCTYGTVRVGTQEDADNWRVSGVTNDVYVSDIVAAFDGGKDFPGELIGEIEVSR